jgi:hypothetical protein
MHRDECRARKRINRLLMLMQLHENRVDREDDYRKRIRAWLEANGGRRLMLLGVVCALVVTGCGSSGGSCGSTTQVHSGNGL